MADILSPKPLVLTGYFANNIGETQHLKLSAKIYKLIITSLPTTDWLLFIKLQLDLLPIDILNHHWIWITECHLLQHLLLQLLSHVISIVLIIIETQHWSYHNTLDQSLFTVPPCISITNGLELQRMEMQSIQWHLFTFYCLDQFYYLE